MTSTWMDLTSRKAALVVSLLGIVMAARIAATYPVFNGTIDEGLHIASGVEIYQFQRMTLVTEHPPLPRYALGLPAYLGGVRVAAQGNDIEQGRYIFESGDYWRALTLGRLGNLIFIPVLLFYVYRWSDWLWGRYAGVAAAVLVTNSPNLIAHYGLATMDGAVIATLAGAGYHLHRWVSEPKPSHAAAAGTLAGLALMAKYSAVAFVPLLAVVYVALTFAKGWPDWRSRRALGRAVLAIAFACFCAFAVVWVCFMVNDPPTQHDLDRGWATLDRWTPRDALPGQAAAFGIRCVRLLTPGFLEGIRKSVQHASAGHNRQYLFGEIREREGWWYYFPAAILVKTTLPFLLLTAVVLAAALRRRNDPGRNRAIFPAAGALVILGVGMSSEINIGVRHMLPMWPFVAVAVCSVFRRGEQGFAESIPILKLSAALIAAHVVASAAAHPDYLAYFNELGRGREHRILGDSNLDWGQDLHRLAVYAEEHGIEEIHLSYFGATSPASVGLRGVKPFRPTDKPRSWAAVSVSHLQGLGPPAVVPTFDTLSRHEPHAKIGKSIWLYDLRKE